MHEPCTYQIEVRGQVDEDELNTRSPLQVAAVQPRADEESARGATLLTIHADQSGLIGLMRHLHGRGVVFLSVRRQDRRRGCEEEKPCL